MLSRLSVVVWSVASLAGCGGHTLASPTDAGHGGSANIDAAPVSSSMIAPKKPETVTEACVEMCARLAMVSCMRPTCVTDCQKAVTLPACVTSYIDFLACAIGRPFVCDNGVADLMGACSAQKAEFMSCKTGMSVTMPPPDNPPPDPIVMPPIIPTYDGGRTTACPEIPLLPENAICDDPVADSGVEDAGADAEGRPRETYPTCSRTCREFPGGKEWMAKCEFGKCFCSYGGGQGCGCPQRQFECNVDCCF